jgi:hypothetical protein
MDSNTIYVIILLVLGVVALGVGITYLIVTAKSRRRSIELMEVTSQELLDAWDGAVEGIIEMERLIKEIAKKERNEMGV